MLSLHRQIIARGLLDVFRDFSNNEEDFLTVMEIVVRLSEDAGLNVFILIHIILDHGNVCEVILFISFRNQQSQW